MTDTLSLSRILSGHTITLLHGDRVLVTGGRAQPPEGALGVAINMCEMYDPGTGLWKEAAFMNKSRTSHTATALEDGRVLVTGGYIQEEQNWTASVEVYDPSDDTWTEIPSMNESRWGHAALLLNNGDVLICGPYTCEVYDVENNQWHEAGEMSETRYYHTMYYLDAINKILIMGGDESWEIFDPHSMVSVHNETFPILQQLSKNHVKLQDGRVLVAGGEFHGFVGGMPVIGLTDRSWVYDITTNVQYEREIVDTFSLFQNYPNPFNPSTVIRFSVPAECYVSLKVYDILGREIKTLINGDIPAGTYHIQFNAGSLSSGVYFYTLRAADYIEMKRMVLTR
jgi:hypothetical protein